MVMDALVNLALEEICCEVGRGIHLSNLWSNLEPKFASRGLPLCRNVKRVMWENLVEISGINLVSTSSPSMSTEDLIKCTVSECEELNVKIIAPEGLRNMFLGIHESEHSKIFLSATQRQVLERLATARSDGIAQSELSKELRIPSNNLFYQLKKLEIQRLIVRHPTVIRKKQASGDGELNNSSVVTTNMLYLYRYGKHLGSNQRLEITTMDKKLTDGEFVDGQSETGSAFDKEVAEEDIHVKDFLPPLKAICDKLEKAQGKVLVVADLKRDLGYQGSAGHRAWRHILPKLKEAGVVEECGTVVNRKEVKCLRLLQSFSPSLFEPKNHAPGKIDMDSEQPMGVLNRGQVTEQVVELSILRQIYDMIDAAGSQGVTNLDVCRRLGLCSKEYHKRYFKQMVSRFGLHLQLESHNKCEVYRIWTSRNLGSAIVPASESQAVHQELNQSTSIVDHDSHEQAQPSTPILDISTSVGSGGVNKNENDAAHTVKDTSDIVPESGVPLLDCNSRNSDEEILNGGGRNKELLQVCNAANGKKMLESHSPASVTRARGRQCLSYPHLTLGVTNSIREQRILKMLQEEKILVRAEIHRRLETMEERTTMMDRRTLNRCLNKLQQEGHCICIHISAPSVTNCGRDKTTDVVLHPSLHGGDLHGMTPSLLTKIHEKIRSFETQSRRQANLKYKDQPVPMLDSVERIPTNGNLDASPTKHAEGMRANGFVLAKMVRTKLLHIFLWRWVCSIPGLEDTHLSSNDSHELENPHSSCKLFKLDHAIRSMPLELFLQVVGSARRFDDMVEKCRSGKKLNDLSTKEYKALMDTQATARLSWLIDILRRLKLIRLVSKGHEDDGGILHTTLTHSLEFKPYVEEPVSVVAPSCFSSRDLRPNVRHDFVLSTRKAVDEYWNTLEYCYCAAKSRTALLAFPGSAVPEVFLPRSWQSFRVMTADQRVKLLKRVAKDDPDKKLSYRECDVIAKDLDLTLEQVLRVYYQKRQQRVTQSQKGLGEEIADFQIAKGKHNGLSRKRKRHSVRMHSKLVKTSTADGQSSGVLDDPSLGSDSQFAEERRCLINAAEDYDSQLQRYYTGDDVECPEVLNLNEEDKSTSPKKFSWNEGSDRQLLMEYTRWRAAQGANFYRVKWSVVPNLPAPPEACKRRMSSLNREISFRKLTMRLCNLLAARYANHLKKSQEKVVKYRDSGEMLQDPSIQEDVLHSSDSTFGKWDDFDENTIKEALNDALRCKKVAKLVQTQDMVSHEETSEDDDLEGCSVPNASSKTTQQITRKYLNRLSRGAHVVRQMHESVAIANAAELFKLIFLSNTSAPEVPVFLAETLRRYSEHDLFAAFNYLRDKKIMIGGCSGSPFDLSQQFISNLSSSVFPVDTGKRAAKFSSWLDERENDLIVEGVDIPPDVQCGEVFTLCALMSSNELSITPCLPSEGVGEADDNRTSKRKCDGSEIDDGEIYKKPKTAFAEGEMISRREKGFPGINLLLQREMLPRTLAIELFKDADTHRAPLFGGKDQINTSSSLNFNCGADYEREILNSGGVTRTFVATSESPWEAMASYSEYKMSSCSYEITSSIAKPQLFKTLYSAIQKSGDNGLSMKETKKILNINDDKVLEIMIEVLVAFGRALKVNAYNSVHVVDSLYRSKYFLTSVEDLSTTSSKARKKNKDKHMRVTPDDNSRESDAAMEMEDYRSTDEVHRVTILNLPEDDVDVPTEVSTKDKFTGNQDSQTAAPTSTVKTMKIHSVGKCTPLLPWINGDGTINEFVYKGLVRHVLGIVMQNPGILESEIIKRMDGINPQSCRQFLELLILDKHIICRKMQQKTPSQPPSILGNLLGSRFKKSKLIYRDHYFANPTSTALL